MTHSGMEPSSVNRKLTAILVADVQGYSRLMGLDEEQTLRRLREYQGLIKELIVEHRGRLIDAPGDAFLVEFGSVLEALQCGVKVQKELGQRNAQLPMDRRMKLRIGINLGDVIADGDSVYGDGVNIAARLQTLAEGGGICVSGSVYDNVRNQQDFRWESLGEQTLKNIAQPVRAYLLLLEPAAPEASGSVPERVKSTQKPSIAVLPFENLSTDPEQEYFADGVTEDILTALSRIRWFFVIARHTVFAYKGRAVEVRTAARELGVRYVLEGSTRKAAGRIRVTAQLSDGETGKQLWAKRYDREYDDIFAVQDDLTEAIVGALEPELGKAERERAKSKRPESLDAWDSYQRGLWHLYRYTKDDLKEARRLFGRAADLDTRLGVAFSGLAETYYFALVYGYSDSVDSDREAALVAARKAVELDDEDAGAHCTLGRVHYARREHDAAITELKTAIELSPSLAWGHYGIGAALVFSGRAEEAVSYLEKAITLSPRDPNMGSFLVRMADAHFFMRNHEEAIHWAKKALRQPGFQWSRYAVCLAAFGQLGRLDEARQLCIDLSKRRPDFSTEFVRATHLIANPDDMAYYLEGLKKAGVP